MDFGNHFFSVDETGQRGELMVLADYPRMNGGALIADDLEELIYGIGMSHGQPLQINTYDKQWNVYEGLRRDHSCPRCKDNLVQYERDDGQFDGKIFACDKGTKDT